jgi:hypothetical protein
VVLWVAGVVLGVEANYYAGPTDGAVEVPVAVSLLAVLPWMTLELAVLYYILRPNSFRWSWGRVLAALGIMIPWWFFCGSQRHWQPGDWFAGFAFGHGYWLTCVVLLLIILLGVSVAGAWLASRRGTSEA